MDSLERTKKLLDYDLWANRLAIQSVEPVAQKSERAMKVLGHLLGAQRVWLERFRTHDPPQVQVWPDFSLTEATGVMEGLYREWSEMLSSLSEARLDEDLIFRNTKGVEFKTPIRDVLTHLMMHAAYHRGQIAAAVRDAGGVPASTDYAVYVRQRARAPRA